MNFSFLILEYLKKQGSVSVPAFGTFELKNTNAVVEEDGKSILPPGKKIVFNADYDSRNTDFIKFISAQKNIPEIDAEIEIKKQVNFWNANLHKNKELVVENIGTFFLDDGKIHFTGKKAGSFSPDFYGLEKIKFSEIKSKNPGSYKFGSFSYWFILLIIGILAITYFGIMQPEEIFGRKSFGNGFEKNPVAKIKIDSLKKDSAVAANPNLDSLKTDSAKTVAVPIKAPVKKWSSKNYSQWKKPKKRRNH